jgi:hypothetical protein
MLHRSLQFPPHNRRLVRERPSQVITPNCACGNQLLSIIPIISPCITLPKDVNFARVDAGELSSTVKLSHSAAYASTRRTGMFPIRSMPEISRGRCKSALSISHTCPPLHLLHENFPGRVDAGGINPSRESVHHSTRVRVNRGQAGNVSYPMTIAETARGRMQADLCSIIAGQILRLHLPYPKEVNLQG